MCGYFCIRFVFVFDNFVLDTFVFIDFMFAGSSLIDFTSLFSPYDFKKNDKIIFDYFK